MQIFVTKNALGGEKSDELRLNRGKCGIQDERKSRNKIAHIWSMHSEERVWHGFCRYKKGDVMRIRLIIYCL